MGLGQQATLFDPLPERVLGLEILLSRRHHTGGWLQSLALPKAAALDRPRQNAVPFLEQLFRQPAVTPLGRDRHRERDQVQSPLHRLIHVADRWLVVACDHQLELRYVLEEVLAHETRRHLVATGDGLDLGFVPTPTLFGFDG